MAIYYVRTDGNDGDTGVDWGHAWQTLQKGADTAVAGDTVMIAGDASGYGTGSWTPPASIDFDINSGNILTGPIKFIVTGGTAEFDFTGLVNGFQVAAGIDALMFLQDDALDRWEIKNGSGVGLAHGGVGVGVIMKGVDIHTFNYLIGPGRANLYLANCSLYNATNDGIYSTGVDGALHLYGCKIYNNGGYGVTKRAHGGIVIGNLFYGNGLTAYRLWGSAQPVFLLNNVFYDNDIGVDILSLARSMIFNNIFKDNSTYGFSCGAGLAYYLVDHNCWHGNGADLNNFTKGPNAINEDPLFVNAAAGDFRLKPQSPCRDTGFPSDTCLIDGHYDVGAMQLVQASLQGARFGGRIGSR